MSESGAGATAEDVDRPWPDASVDRLARALQALLGPDLPRPDTPGPARSRPGRGRRPLGGDGRPRVIRRPAGLTTPEAWQVRLAGIDPDIADQPSARRPAGRPRHGDPMIENSLSPVRDPGRPRRRHVLPPLRPALRRAAAGRRRAAAVPDLLSRPSTTTAGPAAWTCPGCASTSRRHMAEHDRHPVGDDDWLETLREGDRLRWGRWTAPFDTVRRYLVTGQVDAGRNRQLAHDVIVTAMTQISRWGPNARHLRRPARVAGRPGRRDRADGALRRCGWTLASSAAGRTSSARHVSPVGEQVVIGRTGPSRGPRSRRSSRRRCDRSTTRSMSSVRPPRADPPVDEAGGVRVAGQDVVDAEQSRTGPSVSLEDPRVVGEDGVLAVVRAGVRSSGPGCAGRRSSVKNGNATSAWPAAGRRHSGA